jgi:hypothetical protein
MEEELIESHRKSGDEQTLDDLSLLVNFSHSQSTDQTSQSMATDKEVVSITVQNTLTNSSSTPIATIIFNKALRFNEMLGRNRRSIEIWNPKTLADVFPTLNNTTRLSALIRAEAVCLIELRFNSFPFLLSPLILCLICFCEL